MSILLRGQNLEEIKYEQNFNDKSLTLWDLYSTLKYRLHHVLC